MKKRCIMWAFATVSVWIVGCGDDGGGASAEEQIDSTTSSSADTGTGAGDGDSAGETDSRSNDTESSLAPSACESEDAVCQPGQTVLCDEVGPEYTDQAAAECLPDCSGWDVSACEEAQKVEIYGSVDVALLCDFVVDVAKIGDVDYQDAHLEHLTFTQPAFTGSIGGVPFPSDEVDNYYETLVMRSPTDDGAELVIVQQGFDAGMRLVNPVIELRLPSVEIASGTDIEVCQGVGVVFYIYDLTPQFQIDCFHAVSGDDGMHVDVAEGLDQPDGGRLHLSGQDISVYHVTETPHGDLTGQLSYPACERLD